MPAGVDGERWRGQIVRFAAAVCAFVGPLLGCIVFGLVSGEPLLFLGVDIAGVPLTAYALVSFAPVGLIAGALAGRLCLALIDRGYAEMGAPAA